ncbi:MAG: 16S rRNA processing protein RimM [Clostridia bacterium]|nr:16S rRNA processing protein RimM [Clostridia bacterium]
MKQYLETGKIVGTHGIKGEMRVECWCDSPQFFCQLKKVYLQNGSRMLEVKSRVHKHIAIMKAKGIDSIEDAEKLRNQVLYMNRNDVTLEEGTYFIQDIIGLRVYDVDSNQLYGKITDVIQTGANDVYQITNDDGKDYLIPVIDEVVISVEPDNEKILIRPLKGIFDDED